MADRVLVGVAGAGVDEHVWHHQDRRRRGPRELTGIVDLTRGKDHPTARLSGPGPRKVWHYVQELAGRAQRRLPRGGANHDLHRAAQSQDSAHWPYVDPMDTLIMA